MDKQIILSQLRDAIKENFWQFLGDTPEDPIVDSIVRRSTYLAEDDPGGWAPRAVCVVHTESGLPNGAYDWRIEDLWFKVSNSLPIYHEPVNGAVIAWYPKYFE